MKLLTIACLLALAMAGAHAVADPAVASAPTAAVEKKLPVVDLSSVPVSDPGSTLPKYWQNGTFMEIYVRGYKDSNGDGIGDLKGLTQSLDYLKDLGITGIWLMPITRSDDHDHGYAVNDYRGLEEDYGTLADFDELLKQAHARGIGVIMDYVINHSSYKNPLFTSARLSPASPYRSWYVWQDSKPEGWSVYGKDPWYETRNGAYFGGFGSRMPDFNLLNPDVIAYHQSSLRYWLNRGIDGFRFDAVGNLVENGPNAWEVQPQNYVIMKGIRTLLDGYQQRYMVCEAPGDPTGFAKDDACGSAFAFGHQRDIVYAAKGDPDSLKRLADYFNSAPPTMATLVSNHDTFAGQRLFDQVQGDMGEYRLAAASNLLLPGIPFIYYGEEIGMAGGTKEFGDHRLRAPMSWTNDPTTAGFTSGKPFRNLATNVDSFNVAAETKDPNSLYAFYKSLLNLRKQRPSLTRGDYAGAKVDGTVFSFVRTLGDERTVVVLNYGTQPATVAIDGLVGGRRLLPLFPASAAALTVSGGSVNVPINGQGILVFAVKAK